VSHCPLLLTAVVFQIACSLQSHQYITSVGVVVYCNVLQVNSLMTMIGQV